MEDPAGMRGICIRHTRAPERGHNAKPLQGGVHGAAPHGLAVARVQHESTRIDVAIAAGRPDKFSGKIGGVTVPNSPSDGAAAPCRRKYRDVSPMRSEFGVTSAPDREGQKSWVVWNEPPYRDAVR